MAGFKNGALALKKKDIGVNADPGFIHILVDTSNNIYTIDEFGVYRSVAGYDIVSSGSDISVVTSGGTKILSLNSTGVVSGVYGNATTVPQIVIDNNGRILSAYNIPISATGLGTVTSVSLSSDTLKVINSPITTYGIFGVNLSATGVVSGSILKPFVDSYGRVLSGGLISATDISDRSTDVSLSANSDDKIPTEKAIKTYTDTKRLYVSTGISTPTTPNFVNNNDGTITIEPTICRLFSTTNFIGNIEEYNIIGNILALTDGIEQHVCISYNSGNPIYYVESNHENINDSNVICVYHVWRQGLEVHSLCMDSLGLGLGNKTLHSINNTTPYKKSYLGGLVISESTTPNPRTVIITSGNVYAGVVEQMVSGFNSSVDRLSLAYHNSGNWLYADNLVYNNTQYDNGTNLVTIGNNKFSVRWFYRSVGDVKQTFYVLGSGEYNNVSDARLELPRIDLPILLRRHCILVGRSIIERSASSGITEPISDVTFSQSIVQNHNDLQNIQGGVPGEYYHLNSSEYGLLHSLSALQEPTGFTDKLQVMSFDDTTRTFNISASSGFSFYYRGNIFNKTSDSITISNTSGAHYIYYTSAGILAESTTPWDISTTVQVTIVYWTGTYSFGVSEERHGTVMDWATHAYNHKNYGTKYTGGFDYTYTLNNDSSASIGISNGVISDEDIEISIIQGTSGNYFSQQINYPAIIPVYYRSGTNTNGSWKKDSATTLPYKNSGGTGVNFNALVTGNWTQTQVSNTNYCAYFIYATDIIREPIISIQGQRQDTSLPNAQNNNNPTSLQFSDFPVAEAKLLFRIILETKTSYSGNIYRSRIAEVTDYRNSSVNLTTQGSTGTVTYVGLSANPILSISGSPITNAGTFNIEFSNQTSGTFLAGPVSGTSAIPTFRNIQFIDLPISSLSDNYLPLSGGTLTGTLTLLSGQNGLVSTNTVNQTSAASIKINNIAAGNGIIVRNTGISGCGIYIQQMNTNPNSVGLYVYSNSPAPGIVVDGKISATQYFVHNGLSTQFLKANGTVDSNTYATTSLINKPVNEIVYGTGSGITSSPKFITSFSSTWNGVLLNSPNTAYASFFSLGSNSNTSSTWSIEKRDAQDFGTTLGCFTIEDSLASADNKRFPVVIDAGSAGDIKITRNLRGRESAQTVWSKDVSPIASPNTNYVNAPLVTQRIAGSGNSTVAGIGFHNIGVNASMLYYDPTSSNFMHNSYAGGIYTLWDSRIFTPGNYLPLSGGTLTGQLNGTFAQFSGRVSAGNASFGNWALADTYSWFGRSNQNNGTNGFSGFLQDPDGTISIYSPNTKSTYLGIGSAGVLQISLGWAYVYGKLSATDIYNAGSYYVSNYSGGGSPAIITNQGNGTLWTLGLEYAGTGNGALRFADFAYFGASYNTSFFYDNGKYNNLTIRGYGNSQYSGLCFTNGENYIGSKPTGYYLGSSTKSIYIQTPYTLYQQIGHTAFGLVSYLDTYNFSSYNYSTFYGTTKITNLKLVPKTVSSTPFTVSETTETLIILDSSSNILNMDDSVVDGKIIYVYNNSGAARTITSTVGFGLELSSGAFENDTITIQQHELLIGIKLSSGIYNGGWKFRKLGA